MSCSTHTSHRVAFFLGFEGKKKRSINVRICNSGSSGSTVGLTQHQPTSSSPFSSLAATAALVHRRAPFLYNNGHSADATRRQHYYDIDAKTTTTSAGDHVDPMHSSSAGSVYGGGRVPPPHPFLRSSSVPEQPYDPLYLGSDPVDPFHHATSASASTSHPPPQPLTPFPGSGPRSFFNGSGHSWRSTSYLDEGAHGSSGLRGAGGRLGRQFSLSTELPTSYGGSGGYGGRHHHHYANEPAASSHHLYGRHHQNASSFGGLGGRSPITLGRSLQMVTGSGAMGTMGGATTAGGGADPLPLQDANGFGRRKKTVRFNSEEWGAGGPGGGASSNANRFADDCDFEDGELWMTIEDVRSGRWTRWDTLRQESQESQTRDSGIETGSCFTSSEDSNRGDHIHKKVIFTPG